MNQFSLVRYEYCTVNCSTVADFNGTNIAKKYITINPAFVLNKDRFVNVNAVHIHNGSVRNDNILNDIQFIATHDRIDV